MSTLSTADRTRTAEFSAKRLELGYTQKELAALLGVGVSALSHWEGYQSKVNPAAFRLLQHLPPKMEQK